MNWKSAGCAMLLSAGCATTERPPRPSPPPSNAEMMLGRTDAIAMSSEYLNQRGFANAKLQSAREVRPNYFHLHFGLPSDKSGEVLVLEFDGTTKRVIQVPDDVGVHGQETEP